ncbi:HNH endonuclease [bacterium]|nr:HNH endonuclease [bacterium]
MANEIISYVEMCQREGSSLQKGMNFRLAGNHSVILMSTRANAPYRDWISENGEKLVYEGHDAPRNNSGIDPKTIDQPRFTKTGRLTENGKFYEAAIQYKDNEAKPEVVHVYEKIKDGIWSYNGVFHLTDAWVEFDGTRSVFKFEFRLTELEASAHDEIWSQPERQRMIPSQVKLEVWKRDGGKCVMCGATDELHFDHIIPFTKGGTSLKPDNVQLLCARHNLAKSDRIE